MFERDLRSGRQFRDTSEQARIRLWIDIGIADEAQGWTGWGELEPRVEDQLVTLVGVEVGHAKGLGGRNVQPPAGMVERARAHPPLAALEGVQDGEQILPAVAVQGQVTTLEEAVINRELGGTSADFQRLTRTLGLPAWQARVPHLVIAWEVMRDLGGRATVYRALPAPTRARWIRRRSRRRRGRKRSASRSAARFSLPHPARAETARRASSVATSAGASSRSRGAG